jgi:polyisoprenoid-binding protein YceI
MHSIPSRRCDVFLQLAATVVGFTILFAAPALAQVQDYSLDPTHTRVAFRADHAGFSYAIGTFRGASGTLRFDESDWSTASLVMDVPVATLDLGDDDWNGKVLDGTFFDAKSLPVARFTSTSVAALAEGRLRVRGDLTIHGVTQPVEFEATVNAVKRHPLTFRRTAGFSAVLKVSRKAFAMGAWPGVIGDEVEILVELEASRARNASGKSDAATSRSSDDGESATADDVANDPTGETTPTDEPVPEDD